MVRVTQQQVAKKAGVTRATVSYVLTGRARSLKITEAVIQRVEAAARELGYAPNYAARSLVSGKSKTLGLALGAGGYVSLMWSLIAEGVETEALKAGYDVLIISDRRDTESGPAGLEYLRRRRIDALISLGRIYDADAQLWKQAPTLPVVLEADKPPQGLPSVRLDPATGYRAAIEHLARNGHRRLLWIGPSADKVQQVVPNRAEVARKIARELGLSLEALYLPDVERIGLGSPVERAITVVPELLQAAIPDALPATAVLCWNDQLALGLYRFLSARGLRIPDDVSVVGFDNHEAVYGQPPISSITQEFRETGRAAAQLALQMADGSLSMAEARKTIIHVPSRFIARPSVGAGPFVAG